MSYLKSNIESIQHEYKEIKHFVVGNSFGNTLKTFLNQGDVLLLNLLGTTTSVGLYTVAKKLAYAILTVTDPLVTSIYPQLAHLVAQRKYNELKEMLIRITKLASIPVSFFTLIVFVFKGDIIVLFYGKAFITAANTFFIHFIGAVQGSLFFWCLPLVQGLGLTQIRLKSYLVALLFDLIIAFSLTPTLGPNGVAIGLLTANLITTFFFVSQSYKKINLEIDASLKQNNT